MSDPMHQAELERENARLRTALEALQAETVVWRLSKHPRHKAAHREQKRSLLRCEDSQYGGRLK